MKRFIKAAWHTFNAPPSRGYFTTENMHLFENIHSALEELRLSIELQLTQEVSQ